MAMLDNKAQNGWTPTALGVAAQLWSNPRKPYSKDAGEELLKRCKYGQYMPRKWQISLSRVLHLIDTNRLKPEWVPCPGNKRQHGMTVRAVRCDPPPDQPKPTQLACRVGRGGITLTLRKPRTYTDAELYLGPKV